MTVVPSLTLDHLGVAVRDLAQARAIYTKLGFNLTDLSIHYGQPTSSEQGQPLGSGNHCAMFYGGYLELIGVVDPSKPSSVGPFLEKRSGGFITAFGCANAQAAYDEAAQYFSTTRKPLLLERFIEKSDGTIAKAQFRNVVFDADFPESRTLMIQHLTPDLIWTPDKLDHPNGTLALVGAHYLVNDMDEAVERYSRLLGAHAEKKAGYMSISFGGQTCSFFEYDNVTHEGLICPSLLGAQLKVKNLQETEKFLQSSGMDYFVGASGEIVVAWDRACNFSIAFTG